MTFSYINVLGFLLFVIFLLQLGSGVLLSIYYNSWFSIAFDSIVYISININNGYLVRFLHILFASFFLFVLYLHFIRSFWLRLRVVYARFITFMVVVSGYLLLVLALAEGFIGYLLIGGQMSYGGITVLINLIAVFPYCGVVLGEFIWCCSWVLLNRIFIYHFLLGLAIGLLVFVHILILHAFSSCNPFINNNTLMVSFYPFVFKDLWISFGALAFTVGCFIYFEPDVLGNSDNIIIANPLITPSNILPEGYYLLFHSCLRSSPNKSIGVIVVLNLFVVVLVWAVRLCYKRIPGRITIPS